MAGFIPIVDRVLTVGVGRVCALLLAAMVGFTLYTVVMRTVFLSPPFWGDTLTLFANIWMVMLAFAGAIYSRRTIAMEAFYVLLPRRLVTGLRLLWTLLYAALGVLLAVWGYEAATRIPGAFWELGNLPKSYPMMILPISGILVFVAALMALAVELREPRETGPAGDAPDELKAAKQEAATADEMQTEREELR